MKKNIFKIVSFFVVVAIVSYSVYMYFDNKSLESQTNKITLAYEDNSYKKEKQDIKKDILLVNKEKTLSEEYMPKNLTRPKVKFLPNGIDSVKNLNGQAAKALENTFNAAKKDKVTLLAVSGYRSYDYQKTIYDNEVRSFGKERADKYVAHPGTSEHQTGLSMDVASQEYAKLDEGFTNTKAYKWIKENCFKYGFIIRYPKGKEKITGYNFEPWHLRYVGVEAATEIMKKGITLEEYMK